jgi:hypothetical protein
MIITAFVIGVVIALIASPFVAVGIMVSSRETLAKMQELVDQYNDLSPEDRMLNALSFRRELVALKAKISTMDKQSTERARDLLAMI